MDHESDGHTSCNWTEELENKRMSGDHPKYSNDRPEYGEESWKVRETRSHSNSGEKPSANAGVENSQKSIIIIIIIIIINSREMYYHHYYR